MQNEVIKYPGLPETKKLNLMTISRFFRSSLKKRQMINFYKRFIRASDLCFDIGANIGERTEIFLKLGAKTVAVEPQTGCIEVLRNKFGNSKNLEILQYAVGSSESEEDLMICEESSECSTLSKDFINAYAGLSGFHWGKKEKTRVTTLENLCSLYGMPAFCKIDVEGYESEVFSGMKRPVRFIAFEFNKLLLNDTIKSLDILQNLGVSRCNFIKYEIMNLALDRWIHINEFREKFSSFITPDILTGEIIVEFV